MVLISMLKRAEVMKHTGWETDYRIKRPGVYQFFMEPQPYWEPAEDCYIVQAVVTAFGAYS